MHFPSPPVPQQHNFHVIRSAGQTSPNYIDPIVRDVVNIGAPPDNVTIRFRTDNPGPWFLHCHIDWHLEIGFAMVFAEGLGQTAVANPVPGEFCFVIFLGGGIFVGLVAYGFFPL